MVVGLVGCTWLWSQGQYLLCLILAVSREGWRYVLKSPSMMWHSWSCWRAEIVFSSLCRR